MRIGDLDAVVKAILWVRDNDLHNGYPRSHELCAIRKALRCVEETPTVDAVPVVRCKDCDYCIWYTKVNHLLETQSVEYWCTHGAGRSRRVEAGHFCSYGERKDGEG